MYEYRPHQNVKIGSDCSMSINPQLRLSPLPLPVPISNNNVSNNMAVGGSQVKRKKMSVWDAMAIHDSNQYQKEQQMRYVYGYRSWVLISPLNNI